MSFDTSSEEQKLYAEQMRHQARIYQNVKFCQEKQEVKVMSQRRLVRVYVVDPNENVPLDQALIYSGEEMLTDATDQELFFEIDLRDIVADHNKKRVKIVDKKIKERTQYLEPIKIRDLRMTVVNYAAF